MPVIVLLELRPYPDRIDKLVDFLEEALPSTRQFNGCDSLTVTHASKSPEQFVIVQHWASRTHYEAYVSWRQARGDLNVFSELLVTEPKVTYLEVFEVAADLG